jgi:signal transduction histidine kinase
MSIKYKLTMMLMGISLAAVLLTVTAITSYLIYDMRGSKLKELSVTATLAGDRNSAAIAFMDNARARSNLEIFHLNAAIKLACIYDNKGQYFAGYETRGGENPPSCPPNAQAIPSFMQGMFTVQSPIEQKNERLGTVFMASDKRDIDEYVNKAIMISVTVAIMVLLVTLLLSFYFQRTISGPILELAAKAQMITRNRDYSLEANSAYPDETGILAHAFNDMLGEVRKRDLELRNSNETLEQKVLQRTQQLEYAKQKAEEASEAKTEFLRNMSHEFRTPLHAIISFATYGINEHESALRSQMKQYFELIQLGASRINKLVDEVLDLAKLEHGEHMFMLQRGDIKEIVSRSAEMVRPMLKEKQIGLHFEYEATSSSIVCDHDKIVQVMTNLLANAIKFTPKGSGIFVKTSSFMKDGVAHTQVSVRDDGVGIPQGEEELIFESFRQSSRTNTKAGGTGLGLAICRNIIKAHKGIISARNNDNGTGACVIFSFPSAMKEGTHIVQMQSVEEKHENAA